MRLAYNWQAEFRSLHLWHHPALKEYKTMMWVDADAFCTKPWEQDPIEYFVKNDGVIMYDHFPQAQSNMKIQPRIAEAFNHTLCDIKISDEGNFAVKLGKPGYCLHRGVPNIHGFFHITNLDWYRQPVISNGLRTLWGDCFMCRFPDDQLAVTAPAAIFAPEKSWDMRSKGIKLDIFHNGFMDGQPEERAGGFLKYWPDVAKFNLPSADGICPITARN
jgi:hypothetical protein